MKSLLEIKNIFFILFINKHEIFDFKNITMSYQLVDVIIFIQNFSKYNIFSNDRERGEKGKLLAQGLGLFLEGEKEVLKRPAE